MQMVFLIKEWIREAIVSPQTIRLLSSENAGHVKICLQALLLLFMVLVFLRKLIRNEFIRR